jgi:CheY-like chemotaxis protein
MPKKSYATCLLLGPSSPVHDEIATCIDGERYVHTHDLRVRLGVGRSRHYEAFSRVMQPIFVVEDDDDIRDLMCILLEEEGYAVVCASTGTEALDQLRAGLRPVLVLLDLHMPGMSGTELVQAMKTSPSLLDAPIVAFTGKTVVKIAGVDDVLMKPPNLDEVLALVSRYCRRRPVR